MAVIKHGSFDNFSATVRAEERESRAALNELRTFSLLRETTRDIQPVPVEFGISNPPRGLALKSIKLTQGFEGFFQSLLNKENEVYFLSWAWDFSGNPPELYPGVGVKTENCIIPLKTDQEREFLGAGILLFPPKFITAGLAIRIHLWESNHKVRDLGKTIQEVVNVIKTSELNNHLSLISVATGLITGTTIDIIKNAAPKLAEAIDKILQANSDDYVDLYEGYYPAAVPWTTGDEIHRGHASEITLTRL